MITVFIFFNQDPALSQDNIRADIHTAACGGLYPGAGGYVL